LENEQKFSIDARVGVYPEPCFRFDVSTGQPVHTGWRVLLIQRADIVARGEGLTREHAFALAKARFEKR
jgi:hypothetical protein